MKKLIATTAAALFAAATLSAGDGLKVSGFIRGGISGDLSDMVAAEDDGDTIGATWVGGDYFGGPSRGRFNANYDGDNGGVEFRFQPDLGSSDYFTNKSVKWAMAYANFFDGAVVVEAGKLHDRFTTTGGWEDFSFGSSLGARVVLHPIESLYLTVQGSDYNPAYYHYSDAEKAGSTKKERRDGKAKFDGSLFSVSAKFATESFFITGGAHLSGIFYGSFGFTGIDNLTFVAEAKADYAKHYTKSWVLKDGEWSDGDYYYYKDRDYTDNLMTDVWIEYDADPVSFGVVGYFWIADDKYFETNDSWISKLIPAVQYKMSDLVALRAESTLFISYDTDVKDHYATITPSVVFNASEKAEVNVWLKFSTDTDISHHATGVGVKYAF